MARATSANPRCRSEVFERQDQAEPQDPGTPASSKRGAPVALAECRVAKPLPATNSPGWLQVDNSPLYHKFREALAVGQFHMADSEPWPTAELFTRTKSLKAVAQLRPDPDDLLSLSAQQIQGLAKQMAEAVMAMNDTTADVLDFISAAWLREARHPEAMVTVSADDFLRLRGLKPQKSGTGRRGGYKDELRQEVGKHIDLLANTWLTVFEMQVVEIVQGTRGPYRRRTTWRGESRALIVSSRFGAVTPEGALNAYSWRVRPGDVFARFLFGPGRQTALLSQKALAYDPYRQKWEKRLTRYFAWHWRNSRCSRPCLFRVQTLLEAVHANICKTNPLRTKKRLERALHTLLKDGVIANWHYEPPGDSVTSRRGWWNEWLKAKVLVEPPKTVSCHYAQLRQRRSQALNAAVGNSRQTRRMKN